MVCLTLSSTNFIWSILESLDSYVGDLIYGIRLQVIVQDRLAKNISQCFVQKKIKKMNFVSDGGFWQGGLNFSFSVAPMKLNYDDMFSFPSKLKFDDKQQLHKALDYGAENH